LSSFFSQAAHFADSVSLDGSQFLDVQQFFVEVWQQLVGLEESDFTGMTGSVAGLFIIA
jgi:hypothetical protein